MISSLAPLKSTLTFSIIIAIFAAGIVLGLVYASPWFLLLSGAAVLLAALFPNQD